MYVHKRARVYRHADYLLPSRIRTRSRAARQTRRSVLTGVLLKGRPRVRA